MSTCKVRNLVPTLPMDHRLWSIGYEIHSMNHRNKIKVVADYILPRVKFGANNHRDTPRLELEPQTGLDQYVGSFVSWF